MRHVLGIPDLYKCSPKITFYASQKTIPSGKTSTANGTVAEALENGTATQIKNLPTLASKATANCSFRIF
jgi:hypothetical protein